MTAAERQRRRRERLGRKPKQADPNLLAEVEQLRARVAELEAGAAMTRSSVEGAGGIDRAALSLTPALAALRAEAAAADETLLWSYRTENARLKERIAELEAEARRRPRGRVRGRSQGR
jgi:BMFP domain-containing protein YqiC